MSLSSRRESRDSLHQDRSSCAENELLRRAFSSGRSAAEFFDHVIVLSEGHARRLLRDFQVWYNEDRPHLALEKDAPDHRPVEAPESGEVIALLAWAGYITGTRAALPEAAARPGPHPATLECRRAASVPTIHGLLHEKNEAARLLERSG